MNPELQKNNPQGNQESFYISNISESISPAQGITEEPACLRRALLYRQRGMCPIPIKPDSKKPFISWEQFQHRLPSEDEIRQWWVKWPQANVALVCGHGGFVVLDIDVKNQPPARKMLADQ